jgi:hypothetical protein
MFHPRVVSVTKGAWVHDDSQTTCTRCHTEFSLFIRRHHCRRCGHIFCYFCSNAFVYLEEEDICPRSAIDIDPYEAQRVCLDCHSSLHTNQYEQPTSALQLEPLPVEGLGNGELTQLYAVTIPEDFVSGQSLRVELDGRQYVVCVPSAVRPGQRVRVAAPVC